MADAGEEDQLHVREALAQEGVAVGLPVPPDRVRVAGEGAQRQLVVHADEDAGPVLTVAPSGTASPFPSAFKPAAVSTCTVPSTLPAVTFMAAAEETAQQAIAEITIAATRTGNFLIFITLRGSIYNSILYRNHDN